MSTRVFQVDKPVIFQQYSQWLYQVEPWCIMCRHCGESVDHLLLHCEMAYRLWSFVFITFGLSWVVPRSIPNLLFGWWNWLGKHSSQIWNLVPLWIFWCIWKERNRRTFEDLNSSGDQMLASFRGTLFY